jgi:hypothetical protein
VSIKQKSDGPGGGRGRAWPLVIAAVAAFSLLGAMPVILAALHVHLQPAAATSSRGVRLLPAPGAPQPVSLPAVAQPIDPDAPPASLSALNGTREAAAVSAEDNRIRILLHDASHLYQPEVIPTRGALPTLVLTAGQGSYTEASLAQYGALVRLPDHAALLLDNVFVASNAQLSLGSSALRTLYLDNGTGGFASIVAWGGNLSFHGSARYPMTIMGWDRTVNMAASDSGSGRSYIREVGGKMTLSGVRVSSLGFWSGRTGGVAWTGRAGSPSTGGATESTFTDDTYGAFVSQGSGVTFRDDLFEFNELDGVHIHRYSVNSSVIASSASRNGGNGFIVSPATQSTLLEGDVSEHNAGDGYFVNGKPLASGASASGGSVAPGSGTTVEDSAALGNGRIGILVEGGTGTVIKADQVCASITAIAVRYNVTDAILTGNYVRCDPRSGFSIGPDTPGLILSGNTLIGPRTGVLVSASGPIELDNNHIADATVFGVSARGASAKVTGVGNVISGTGFRAIDARADATVPALSATNVSGWAYHGKVSFWSYLRFHPLAALWLSIGILVLLTSAWSHRRRLPAHPYQASTRWRGDEAQAAPAHAGVSPSPRAEGSTQYPQLQEPATVPVPVLGRTLAPAAVPTGSAGAAPVASTGRGWAAAVIDPFPAITRPTGSDGWPVLGNGRFPNGGHGPSDGGSRPPLDRFHEPGQGDGNLVSADRESRHRPPWESAVPPRPAPGDSGEHFDAFSPLPREVDRQ